MIERKFRWPQFQRVQSRAVRTEKMMEALRVDPIVLARLRRGRATEEVMRACLQCHNGEQCRRWLEAEPTIGPAPDFCPNTETFLKCQRSGWSQGEAE